MEFLGETERISNNNAIMLLLSRFLTAVFKTFILKVIRRLPTSFREISKSQDRDLNITNRSEIWQAHLWQYCRDVSWISEQCNNYDIASCVSRVRCLTCHPNFSNMTPDSLHPLGSPLSSDWPEPRAGAIFSSENCVTALKSLSV